jgi:nitrite reductase/ring-hydroxylating ferredoxin subunit
MATSNCCPHGRAKVYCDVTNKQFFLLGHAEAEWLDVVFCPWCGKVLDVKDVTDLDPPVRKKSWLEKMKDIFAKK